MVSKIIKYAEESYIVILPRSDNPDSTNGCSYGVLLFWGDNKGGCYWEPQYGPATLVTPCLKNHPFAEKHWFYEYSTGRGDWSQGAVDINKLPNKFIKGDFDGIFQALKDLTMKSRASR